MASVFDIAIGSMGAGAGVGSIFTQMQTASEQRELLKTQEIQLEMQNAQQSIARTQKLREVVSAQTAMVGSRGVSAASSSVRAASETAFSAFDRDEHAAALNLSFKKSTIKEQMAISRMKETGEIFGSILSTASLFAVLI